MIILQCRICHNVHLEKPKKKGFVAHCPECKKDLLLYRTEFVFVKEHTDESAEKK